MNLSLFGTLPVSSLNLGLASAPAGLATIAAKLSGDVANLQGAITVAGELTADVPDPVSVGAGIAASLNVAEMTALLNPTAFATASADLSLEAVAELGVINGQLGALNPIVANLKTGLTAPDLSGWTYRGRTQGFGTTLATSTRHGLPLGTAAAGDQIDALIIATRSFQSWGTFGQGFEVGDTASEDLGAAPSLEQLRYLGTLEGSRWNIGARAALEPLESMRLTLEGAKLAVENQIQLLAGLNLPAPQDLIDIGLSIDLDAALANIGADVDLGIDISGLEARIETVTALSVSIGLQLAAGGLSLWSYHGRADGLGAALETELRQGLPGTTDGPDGACYGLVIATANAAAWQSFGLITATG